MEAIIVSVIVATAAIYVLRLFYKGFKQDESCGCGCSGCSTKGTCDDILKE